MNCLNVSYTRRKRFDESLLRQALTGDRGALGSVLRREQPLMRRMSTIPRPLQVFFESRDIVQVASIEALRSYPNFEGDYAAFRRWLGAVTRNVRNNALRSVKKRIGGFDSSEEGGRSEEQDRSPHQPSPLDMLVTREQWHILHEEINRLRDDQRQVVQRAFFYHWSNERLAQAMNRSVGAISLLKNRALNHLRQSLKRRLG